MCRPHSQNGVVRGPKGAVFIIRMNSDYAKPFASIETAKII